MILNHFEAIYYINLEHRTDRKKSLLKELKRLGVDEKKIVRINAHNYPLNGTLGCCLSHIKAIELAIQNNLKNVLILEDDCYFFEDTELVNQYVKYFFQTVDDFDIFMLGSKIFKYEETKYPYIKRILQSITAHAYCINKHYMHVLLDNFKNSYQSLSNLTFFHDKKYKFAIDRNWHALQEKDKWYTGHLVIAGQKESYSDIDYEVARRTISALNQRIIKK